MSEKTNLEPERKPYPAGCGGGSYWTCPKGWVYPCCGRCGHNFNESRPIPVGTKSTIERCHWCRAEDDGTLNTEDYVPYQY